MLFSTDKQTLDDLNIFGRHGAGSVYNIFNRCITRGGAAMLEELFRYPLSDAAAINRRSHTIQYFAKAAMAFPFEATLFDAIEPYLANTDERTRLSTEKQGIGKKFTQLVVPEATTALIYRGVQAVSELLNGLYRFIAGTALFGKDEILQLLHDPAFETVLRIAGGKKLSHNETAAFDILFRFRHRDTIQKILRHVYYLDVCMGIASVAREKGFAFAKALPPEQHGLLLQGVYHPLVPNAITNDIEIAPAGNLIFLTGANMAGKSTFMKALGIAMFLAHMGFPVAAKQMEFSVLDGIYTTINLPDNLGMGASHFYAEVLRVKKIARELRNKNLFVVFDELFRGTNVKDAYEATIAVTAAFAGKRNSLFVISTHIIEAGEVLKQRCGNVRFLYLPTRMQGTQPVYTYKIEEGITDDRHGMVIIKNEGILDIL